MTCHFNRVIPRGFDEEQIRRRRLLVEKGSVSFIPSAEEKATQDILGPLKHLRSTNPRSTEVEKFSHSGRGVEGAIGGSSLNGTLAIKPPHAKGNSAHALKILTIRTAEASVAHSV